MRFDANVIHNSVVKQIPSTLTGPERLQVMECIVRYSSNPVFGDAFYRLGQCFNSYPDFKASATLLSKAKSGPVSNRVIVVIPVESGEDQLQRLIAENYRRRSWWF
jgi:hypothetical protein